MEKHLIAEIFLLFNLPVLDIKKFPDNNGEKTALILKPQ